MTTAIADLDAGRVLAGFGGADTPALGDGLLGVDVHWVEDDPLLYVRDLPVHRNVYHLMRNPNPELRLQRRRRRDDGG